MYENLFVETLPIKIFTKQNWCIMFVYNCTEKQQQKLILKYKVCFPKNCQPKIFFKTCSK